MLKATSKKSSEKILKRKMFYLNLISSGNFSFTVSAIVTGNGSERVTEFSTKTRSATTFKVPTCNIVKWLCWLRMNSVENRKAHGTQRNKYLNYVFYKMRCSLSHTFCMSKCTVHKGKGSLL